MSEQTSKHLDSRLRATRIAKEIVFEESVNPESKQLQCRLDRMDKDIAESCSTGRRIEECEEIHCGGLHIPVSLKRGLLEFTIRGIQFKIHRSIPEDDAVRCAETIIRLSREDDDIGTMENPIIEMGTKGSQGENEVAATEIKSGKIRFHKHKTGRLWVCAIDEITKSKGREYLHTPLELLARHGFWPMLAINPEIQNIGLELAKCLGSIRANPDKRKREIAVKELRLIADGLNPHYCPGKAADWMGNTMSPANRGVQSRQVLRREEEDAILAEELLAEALASLRGENRQLAKDLATPKTGMRELVEACRTAEPVAIRWGKCRKPEIIPADEWFPHDRLIQTVPAYGYSKVVTGYSGFGETGKSPTGRSRGRC